jgi:hypothetical protein
LLWKLRLSQQEKAVLTGIFLLPLIPIAFAIVKLVCVNPKSGPVDMVKFSLYYMLENTTGM